MTVRQDIPSDIAIPEWVPAVIHYEARRMYQRAVEHHQELPVAMIKRLICDERMKAVWVKLRQKQSSARQDLICFNLFGNTVTRMQYPILKVAYPSYTELASRLRDDARRITKQRPTKKFGRLAAPLQKAAKAYDDLAKTEPPDDEIKDAVRDLSCLVAECFGSVHHQTTATIASVALNRKISVDDVRNWLRADAVKIGKTT